MTAAQISDDAQALLAIEAEVKRLGEEEALIRARRDALLLAYDKILSEVGRVASVQITNFYGQRGAYVGLGMGRPIVGRAAH